MVRPGRRRMLVGLALVAPAAVALLVSYVLPTVWTVRTSFKRVDPLSDDARNVGWDNYDTLTQDPGTGLGFALALGVLPMLTVVIVCPLLAYAASRAGWVGRRAVRLALVLPTVAFVPTAFAVGAVLDDTSRSLADPSSVWPAALAVGGLAVLTVVAVAAQSFTYPWLMTRGGPMNATVTPMLRLFQFAFERFQYGPAAAHAVLIVGPDPTG